MHYFFVFRTVIHSKQKVYVIICKRHLFVFPPNYFIDDARVALNDSRNLHGHVFSSVPRYRCAKAFRPLHPDSHLHRLQEGVRVDSGEYKAARVQRLGALVEVRMLTAGNGLPTDRKKLLSSGSVPLSETTAKAFIWRQL